MADYEQVPAPQGTTEEPTVETQPQPAPEATPQGTTPSDEQKGTTGDPVKAEKEPLYQTKYQQLKEEQKQLLSELSTYRQEFGPIKQEQPVEEKQETPLSEVQQDAEEQGFDPWDAASMKKYMDSRFESIQTNLTNVAQQAIVQAREQERIATEQREVYGKFQSWCQKNEVPTELIEEAGKEFSKRFDPAASQPSAIIEWVSDYIVKHSEIEKGNLTQQQQVTEAVEKAKALAGIEHPAPGAAPGVASPPEKSWQEKEADTIAPDQPYVPPGG